MDKYKKWIFQLLLTSTLLLVPILITVMGFNYYIDPLWNFNHKNDYNTYQIGFDERQQKTNYITSRPFNYDSLLLGTSRVTYMDQTQFKENNVYNYSLSELHINEYGPFIEYAKKQKKSPFDKIYMELYFESFRKGESRFKDPNLFFENSENPFYRYTSLFSYSTMKRSIDNMGYSKADYYDGYRSYNRDNVASTIYVNENIKESLEGYPEWFEENKYEENYPYDPEYIEKLKRLTEENPSTNFVVFTDTMPAGKLKAILNDPYYWEMYERWIREMLEVFGEVYSFQTVNEYTSDEKYWFDNFHYYPNVGDKIIANLEGRENDPSFCIRVTKENVEAFFITLKKMIK